MINFNFPGQYRIEFGLLRDTKKDPYTTNKYGLINNANNKEIVVNTGLGALAGVSAGGLYNDLRAARETNKRLTFNDLNKRIKGGWKAKTLGAAIGATAIGGTQLLLRKTRKDKGKKRGKYS